MVCVCNQGLHKGVCEDYNLNPDPKTYFLCHFQTRQPVFVQLLSAAFRVSQCHFVTLSVDQRVNVENCIRTLSEVAKARAIAIPSDLDMKVKYPVYV